MADAANIPDLRDVVVYNPQVISDILIELRNRIDALEEWKAKAEQIIEDMENDSDRN